MLTSCSSPPQVAQRPPPSAKRPLEPKATPPSLGCRPRARRGPLRASLEGVCGGAQLLDDFVRERLLLRDGLQQLRPRGAHVVEILGLELLHLFHRDIVEVA